MFLFSAFLVWIENEFHWLSDVMISIVNNPIAFEFWHSIVCPLSFNYRLSLVMIRFKCYHLRLCMILWIINPLEKKLKCSLSLGSEPLTNLGPKLRADKLKCNTVLSPKKKKCNTVMGLNWTIERLIPYTILFLTKKEEFGKIKLKKWSASLKDEHQSPKQKGF